MKLFQMLMLIIARQRALPNDDAESNRRVKNLSLNDGEDGREMI